LTIINLTTMTERQSMIKTPNSADPERGPFPSNRTQTRVYSAKTSAQSSLSSRKHRSTFTSNYLAKSLRIKLKVMPLLHRNCKEATLCK
jgi:hypothetical protein